MHFRRVRSKQVRPNWLEQHGVGKEGRAYVRSLQEWLLDSYMYSNQQKLTNTSCLTWTFWWEYIPSCAVTRIGSTTLNVFIMCLSQKKKNTNACNWIQIMLRSNFMERHFQSSLQISQYNNRKKVWTERTFLSFIITCAEQNTESCSWQQHISIVIKPRIPVSPFSLWFL